MELSIIGPPGSGKTTQAKVLAQKLSLPHVSMGMVCREVAEEDSPEGSQVKAALEKGVLVDDGLVLKLFHDRVSQEAYRSGFVADGNPRTLYQARKMEEEHPFDKIIYVGIPLAVAKERLLKRGRSDDTEETIAKRFEVYEEQSAPVRDFYRQKGRLIEVDGSKAIEAVTEEIMEKLSHGN